jgi:hypothetical protein
MTQIICPLFPPAAIVNLEEEIVSNGFLPAVDVGFLLAAALWTLGGQARSHGFWLGSYAHAASFSQTPGSHAVPGNALFTSFLLKPGARTVTVELFCEFGVGSSDYGDFEITGILGSGDVEKTRTLAITGSGVDRLEYARQVTLTFEDVGDFPGRMANRDENAYLVIAAPNFGVPFQIWGLLIHQEHTVRIEQ